MHLRFLLCLYQGQAVKTHKMRFPQEILDVQAKAVAEHLKEYDIQRVYVSPFYRSALLPHSICLPLCSTFLQPSSLFTGETELHEAWLLVLQDIFMYPSSPVSCEWYSTWLTCTCKPAVLCKLCSINILMVGASSQKHVLCCLWYLHVPL